MDEPYNGHARSIIDSLSVPFPMGHRPIVVLAPLYRAPLWSLKISIEVHKTKLIVLLYTYPWASYYPWTIRYSVDCCKERERDAHRNQLCAWSNRWWSCYELITARELWWVWARLNIFIITSLAGAVPIEESSSFRGGLVIDFHL